MFKRVHEACSNNHMNTVQNKFEYSRVIHALFKRCYKGDVQSLIEHNYYLITLSQSSHNI